MIDWFRRFRGRFVGVAANDLVRDFGRESTDHPNPIEPSCFEFHTGVASVEIDGGPVWESSAMESEGFKNAASE